MTDAAPTPTRCECDDKPTGMLWMAATTSYILQAIEAGYCEPGPNGLAMLHANPSAAWCLHCGGKRDDSR